MASLCVLMLLFVCSPTFNISVQTCTFVDVGAGLVCEIKEGTSEPDRLLSGVKQLKLKVQVATSSTAVVRIGELMPDLQSVVVIGDCKRITVTTGRQRDMFDGEYILYFKTHDLIKVPMSLSMTNHMKH